MPLGVALIVTFRGSNYRCLEQIFMVPKGFEPSNFDCTCIYFLFADLMLHTVSCIFLFEFFIFFYFIIFFIYLFIYFFLIWVLQPFQDYFTYIEPIVHQRWAKTGELGGKPSDHPRAELGFPTCYPIETHILCVKS